MQVTSFIEKKATQAFSCPTWKFEDYGKIDVFEGMYVVGIEKGHVPEPYKSQNKSYEDYDLDYDVKLSLADGRVSPGMIEQEIRHRNQIIDKNDVLISLLCLIDLNKKPEMNHKGRRVWPTPDIDSIIKWCHKYGLPFHEVGEELWSNHGYIGFRIDEFIRLLQELFTGYLLWRRVEFEDTLDENPYKSVSIDECKEMLKLKFARIPLHPLVDFDNEPRIVMRCDNLFNMALAQLAFHMHDNESLSICIECHRPFIRHHGNAKLCELCHRMRHQRTRRKQRAQRNGCEVSAQKSQQ